LYLSYPIIRTAQGYSDFRQQKSRFLTEVPAELMEEWILKPANPWGAYHESPRSQQSGDEEDEPF
jgi:hypothetical protein